MNSERFDRRQRNVNVSKQRLRVPGGRFSWCFLLCVLFAWHVNGFAADTGSNTLDDIQYSALPGDQVQLVFTMSAPVAQPTSFTTDSPARIALDFPGMRSALDRKTRNIGVGLVRSVTAIEAGDRMRVVVNLVTMVPYSLDLEGNKVVLTFQGSGAGAVTERAKMDVDRRTAGVMAGSTAPKPANRRGLENVDFRRGPEGEGRILITLSDPSTSIDVREEGERVVVDFLDAHLPQALVQRLDVTDFATPVTLIDTKPVGRNVHMEIATSGEYEFLAYQADELYTIDVRPLTKAEKERILKEKLIYTGERLSLNFQDIEVRAVLQLLADFTGLNMVTSDTVAGRITLRLKNVPWDQALDIILKTRGLSKRQTDNVMLIAPTEEIAAREKLELESQQQIEELAPLRSEFIQVNYAKAADLAALLKSPDNQLLTPARGNVTVDDRTNTLLVQDTAAKLEDIRRLVETLDIPVRQVLIEARVVIANNDFAKDLGVRFGVTKGHGNIDDGGTFMLGTGGQPGSIGGTNTIVPGIENPAGSTQESLLVNLPAIDPSGAVNLLMGKVGSYLVQLELSAMQKEGKGEIISSPKVITADQNQATIKQGVEIPYQEATSSGATSVSFKEAVLKLDVTPHITPDDRIIMDLIVTKDNPDFSRSVLGVPPVDTREVRTTVLVDNGETVVLGGVYERTKTNNVERVPFFGDLPYVGFLFKNTAEQDDNKELLIFVTPKILKETLGLN